MSKKPSKRGSIGKKLRAFFDHDAGSNEWSEERVPDSERRGVWEPATVWIGFAISFSIAFIGSQVYFGLGMPDALYAIVLGNVILAIYSSFIAIASVDGGLNFPLQMKEAFGRKGALVPIALIAVLVNGWYAFQAWLAADVIRAAWSPSWYVLVIGVTVLFGIPSLVGLDAMSEVVEKLVIPVMVLFAGYILFTQVLPAGPSILSQPAPGESIPFFVGVGMAWSTFAVSGTATGDIVRFAENSKQAVAATIIAFLMCNTGMMILGALSAAALNSLDPYLGMIGLLGSVPLVVVATVSLWSTCDACHYNATMGYSNLSSLLSWRTAAIIGMLAAVITATTEIISNLSNWLNLIGILVPPIGGIIIADYFLVRHERGYDERRTANYNWAAMGVFAVAIALNYYAYVNYPSVLPGLPGLLVCLIFYPLGLKVGTTVVGDERMGAEFERYSKENAGTVSDD